MESKREELRKNVDDIPWNELNAEEKKYVKQHERIEITFIEQLHQTILQYIGWRGRGKHLSWNEYKDLRPSSSKKSSKSSKQLMSALEPNLDRPAKKHKKSTGDWLELVDEPTDSKNEQASVSGRSV